MKSFSICIVSHNAYGAITGGRSGFVGGIEWQTSLLAKWLASRGHKVSFITWDEGGPGEEMVDGVRVLKVCRKTDGVRGVRFVHPRWTSLVKALRRANADVYYQNGGEVVTGQVGLWCRRNRRPFVFSIASDADCVPHPPYFSHSFESAFYRAGFCRADRVIAQTQTQAEKLKLNFNREPVVIPMPCSSVGRTTPKANDGTMRVLWVGRLCPVKRPEVLVEIARGCPELLFDVVGPTQGDAHGERVRRDAETLSNVKFHGQVARDDIHRFYENADVLCCTSEYEGFPNTFLEGWSFCLPTVSTFDPDTILTRMQLGVVVRSASEAISALREIARDPAQRAALGTNARRYFEHSHTVDAAMPRFEQVLRESIDGYSFKK